MAEWLGNGTIRLRDGRVIDPTLTVSAVDMCEIINLVCPRPTTPFWGFSGGRGARGQQGATGLRGPQGIPGVVNFPTHLTTENPYTAGTNGEKMVLVDASAGDQVTNLPVGSNGDIFAVKKVNATINMVTIDPAGAATIDGDTTKVLTVQYSTLTVVSDASGNWHIE